MSALNWLDGLIIVVMVASLLVGLLRGFVRESLALLVWVLALWLSYHAANTWQSLLQTHIHTETVRYWIVFAVVFVVVMVVGFIVRAWLAKLLEKLGLGVIDHVLGGLFGFIRGALIMALLLLFAQMTFMSDAKVIKESKYAGYFQPMVHWMSHRLGVVVRHVAEETQATDMQEKPRIKQPLSGEQKN